GPWLLSGLENVTRMGLTWDRTSLDDFTPSRIVVPILQSVLLPVISLAVVVMIVTVASQLSFGEGRFIGGNIMPKGSRLDPMAGLKRMFGVQGLIEMAKGIAKVGLLGAIAYGWVNA